MVMSSREGNPLTVAFISLRSNSIQAGTPPENIVAMYEAVRDGWSY